jgi:hypothetical protein
MTLKEILDTASSWNSHTQIEFCEQISRHVVFGMRSVSGNNSLDNATKVEAMSLLNEFNHRIYNLKSELLNYRPDQTKSIYTVAEYVEMYSELNIITKGELAPIIIGAYTFIANKKIQMLPLSELLLLEHFRMRTAMYIGEAAITNLNAFISAYYIAQAAHEFSQSKVDYIFKQQFHDWVAEYYKWPASTAGWKNIILEECGRDEKKALITFFELYDIFLKDVKQQKQ